MRKTKATRSFTRMQRPFQRRGRCHGTQISRLGFKLPPEMKCFYVWHMLSCRAARIQRVGTLQGKPSCSAGMFNPGSITCSFTKARQESRVPWQSSSGWPGVRLGLPTVRGHHHCHILPALAASPNVVSTGPCAAGIGSSG